MNLLDTVPALKRHLKVYIRPEDTDSTLAAYLADSIEALSYRWTRDYVITETAPLTFAVDPDIALGDKRGIILMASIIYKMGNVNLASFRDGDFAYDPTQGRTNPVSLDIAELDRMIPPRKLGAGFTAPLLGFSSVFSPESYRRLIYGRWVE